MSENEQPDGEEAVEEYVSGEDMILQAFAAAREEDAVEDEQVEEVAEEAVAENVEEPELILGKFKSPDDLAAAYKELEKKFHERDQEESDDEEWIEDEPAPLLTFNRGEPETEDDLIEWASEDPTRAALWAVENRERITDETFNEVYRQWWQERPWEASAFQREQDMLMMQEYMAQQITPFQQQREEQMLEKANQALLQRIPDIEQYAEKVQEFIQNNDVSGLIPPEAMQNPELLANGIDMIMGIIKWREHNDALRSNPQIGDDNSLIPQPPVVSTGNTAVESDTMDYEDKVRNFILNG